MQPKETYKMYLSDRSLSFKKMQELFNILESIDGIDNINIKINYNEKNKNFKKNCEKTFSSSKELLEHIILLRNIEGIEITLYNNDNVIILDYNYYYNYDKNWYLRYTNETNITNSLAYKLRQFFKTNKIKQLVSSHNTWITFTIGILFFAISKFYDNIQNLIIKSIFSYIIYIGTFLLIILLISLFKKYIPYKNNKLWEEYKKDIILGLIFYLLGAITPYIVNLFSYL